MAALFLCIAAAFWILLLYYSMLLVCGMFFRSRPTPIASLEKYPSVTILIPARNEGKVLAGTLDAMTKLEYPGKLEVLVLNDGSTDDTGDIAEAYSRYFPFIRHIKVPEGTPKGKSRVLNYGLSLTRSDYVAVYDADNQPERDALRLLVEAAERTPGAAGAIGYVRTINAAKNVLTRMIALEFSVFQLVMQAGRWQLFKLGSLPGTNMVLKRQDIVEIDGWDPYALAEDAELTMRLTAKGKLLPVVPESRTWEQEPESFRVWFRQRTRWMQGNVYLILKSFANIEWWRGRTAFYSLQLLAVYVWFVFCVLVSDVWFCLGLLNLGVTHYQVPLLLIWFESCLLYVIHIYSSMVLDAMVDTPNVLTAAAMYFTYAQLWIVILLRGWFRQLRSLKSGHEVVWDKTIRF